jgi:spermidine synthase
MRYRRGFDINLNDPIDKQAVIRLSKKYLPSMAVGFQHPAVNVHIGDGFEFLKNYKNSFDVIITDSYTQQSIILMIVPTQRVLRRLYSKSRTSNCLPMLCVTAA